MPHIFKIPSTDRASYILHGMLQTTLNQSFQSRDTSLPDELFSIIIQYIGKLVLTGTNKFDVYISEFTQYVINGGLGIHRPIPKSYLGYWTSAYQSCVAYFCASSNGYSQGLHEWIIKLTHSKELITDNYGDAIGIIDELKRSSLFPIDVSHNPCYLTHGVNAYYLQQTKSATFIKCQTRKRDDHESQFQPIRISNYYRDEMEDIIQIQLDCNRWKANFIINNKISQDFDIMPNRRYYLFVHSVEYDIEYQLLSQF